jgi:hypothetical protein
MRIHVKTKLMDKPVDVVFFKYATNGRTAIELVDPETKRVEIRATVNVREVEHLPDDAVVLKGWSENEGIPDALIEAGVVGPAIGKVYLRFVNASIHKLLRRAE